MRLLSSPAIQAPPGFTTEEVKDHQDRDDHLRDVQKWKTQPPSETEKQLLSPDQRRLLAFLPSLHQDPSSGLWSLQTQEEGASSERLYIPQALQHRVIEAVHQFLGHAGITATAHFCQEESLHVPTGSRGSPHPSAVPRMPGEESAEPDSEGCTPSQHTSRRSLPSLEHGCLRSPTC